MLPVGKAADGKQGGRFTCTVSADQGDDFPFINIERDAVQGFDITVFHVEIFDFK